MDTVIPLVFCAGLLAGLLFARAMPRGRPPQRPRRRLIPASRPDSWLH